ncbi:hypothetical protein [Deinococcus indicus]|uniref:hypothetical protein n=1 Tax=Deinococcus indicus TaxID=223556 RepID=UPI00117810F6|nr:hypothetical protein [Deinococcus indicus]
MSYTEIIERAARKAQQHIADGTTPSGAALNLAIMEQPMGKTSAEQGRTAREAVDTLINNLNSNKYLFSILVTALTTKIVHPKVDIRNHQSALENSYSNRSTDQQHVTPQLKRLGLTHCATSGMESGRNFERPLPLGLDFPSRPQGKGNRESLLGLLHAVQVEGADPEELLTYLFYRDFTSRKVANYSYDPPKGTTVAQVMVMLTSHFSGARGQGKSRLPVLALQAIYLAMGNEVSRYQRKTVAPLNRHTANDKKGFIGDIQVNDGDVPFEGVEVKDGHPITPEMVTALPQKLQGFQVDRYYILSTAENCIKVGEENAVEAAIEKVRQATGCEIIANGLIRTLWYYLRLLTDPDEVVRNYTDLMATDQDVRDQQRHLWGEILDAQRAEALCE